MLLEILDIFESRLSGVAKVNLTTDNGYVRRKADLQTLGSKLLNNESLTAAEKHRVARCIRYLASFDHDLGYPRIEMESLIQHLESLGIKVDLESHSQEQVVPSTKYMNVSFRCR